MCPYGNLSKQNSGVIPFHFKVNTNRQQGAGSRGKELETNDLYQVFREMVSGARIQNEFCAIKG